MPEQLRDIDENMWVAEQPFRVLGAEYGTRMTVVRLPGSNLWIHSPILATEALRSELDALGNVGQIVAPNCFHHVYAKRMARAYPSATLYAAPGLREKRPDIPFHETLGADAPEAWEGVIHVRPIAGIRKIGEVAFFHMPSRTLVITDLMFHCQSVATMWTGCIQWLFGTRGRPACSRLFRMFIDDREAFRADIDRILEWDFDRVILCHGEILETGGRAALRRVFTI